MATIISGGTNISGDIKNWTRIVLKKSETPLQLVCRIFLESKESMQYN